MGKPFRNLLRRTLYGKKGNLISLDNPFAVMGTLLRGQAVNGILDAGASDGRIAKRLMRLFPNATAYLFEPNPAYTPALEALARKDRRYQPFACALSDREGELAYYQTESPGGCSLFRPTDQPIRGVRTVPAVTIDQWSQRQAGPSIELMKFDIQGGELAALRGARDVLDRSVMLVYCEVWFNPAYQGAAVHSQIDLLLREHGFDLYSIYGPKSDKRGCLQWGNTIYWNRKKLEL